MHGDVSSVRGRRRANECGGDERGEEGKKKKNKRIPFDKLCRHRRNRNAVAMGCGGGSGDGRRVGQTAGPSRSPPPEQPVLPR